jgi:site-specific recombinase XerD
VSRPLEVHSAHRASAGHLQGWRLPEPPRLGIISLFKDTGARLAELAGASGARVSPRDRQAAVRGKGAQWTIRFTYDTARALDRYQRECERAMTTW